MVSQEQAHLHEAVLNLTSILQGSHNLAQHISHGGPVTCTTHSDPTPGFTPVPKRTFAHVQVW